jgi:hypothetical protein
MVRKKGQVLILSKLIGYTIDNLKEEIVILVGGKLGLNHLAICIILLVC